MGIPFGEDPLHTIRYWPLNSRELLEKISRDCQKSLVLWSTTVKALYPEEKLDFPFRFRHLGSEGSA